MLWMAKHTNVPECMMCSYIYIFSPSFFFLFCRYLIDSKWFKSFKRFVGMDDAWDTFGGMDDHPGPIDNSPLFNGMFFHLCCPVLHVGYMALTTAPVMNSEHTSYLPDGGNKDFFHVCHLLKSCIAPLHGWLF
jgi:hypothetical protein